MIKAHPSESMLRNYAAGDLNSASGLVVSTHIDMCPHCSRMIREIEEELTAGMAAEYDQGAACKDLEDSDMQLMLDAIFSSAAPSEKPFSTQTANDGLIYLDGKRFQLPRSLARQQDRIGPWSKMMGNMWRAPINLGTDEVANLIYMGSATSVPEHTHKGTELQLVINGSFSDEYGHYHDGDLLFLDGTHQHTPRTNDEDCLILAVMDGPLHFTSGISRLLNPFSSLFFR